MSIRPMTAFREATNGTKTESAANTVTYEQVEVPNSVGALKVELAFALLDIQDPETIASGTSSTNVALLTGQKSPASLTLSLADTVAIANSSKVCESSAVKAWVKQNHPVNRPVPIRKEQSNKYYVTIVTQSGGQAAAKLCTWRLEFNVYR